MIQAQYGQGQSNIILSSQITVGDAVKAANELKKELKFSKLEFNHDISSECSLQDD